MSMLRKTVLTTAVIGAGLVSTAGAAFAGDSGAHHSDASGGCSNVVQGENGNGAGNAVDTLVEGGSQFLGSSNTCGNFSGNSLGSDNNVAGGSVQNGNSSEETNVSSTNESTSIFSSILG